VIYTYTRDTRDVIGSGLAVVKGDRVELSPEDEGDTTNARLIASGALAPVPAPKPQRPRRTTPQKER
jgi:hypothetical protein